MARKARMSERDKEIVRRYWFEGCSMSELAESAGITTQAVHKLIHSEKAEKYLGEMQEHARTRARGFLIGMSEKAAKVMAEAMDEKDPYARIQASREILERTGVKAETADVSIEIAMPTQLRIGMPEEMEEQADENRA